MENNVKKKIPDVVTIQLILNTIDNKNYCIAYDLKDGKIWKKFDLLE